MSRAKFRDGLFTIHLVRRRNVVRVGTDEISRVVATLREDPFALGDGGPVSGDREHVDARIDGIADGLRSGELVLIRIAEAPRVLDAPRATPLRPVRDDPDRPPPPPVSDLTFVEIGLVDEDGAPLPHRGYRLRLPSGDEVEGRLDAEGRARVDRVEDGDCEVEFFDIEEAVE